MFGSTPASGFTIQSNTQIIAIAPAGSAGPTSVSVADSLGSSTVAAAYTYTTVSTTPPVSGTLQLATDIPAAAVGTAFSAKLVSGGSTPYVVTVSNGALPAGLSIDSTGTLTGTPTTPGWSGMLTVTVKDAANTTVSFPYSMIVNPQLDLYGGISGKTCVNTGRFHTEKQGNRWWLCDPSGNIYWMDAVGGMTSFDQQGTDPSTGVTVDLLSVNKTKYGTDGNGGIALWNWGPQQNRRVQAWGFNAIGQLGSGWVQPIMKDSHWPGDQSQPIKLPMVNTLVVSNYAAANLWNYATNPTKDLMWGINTNYTGWRATFLDFYDPNFATWLDNYFGHDPGAQSYFGSPWVIGLFLDDTDWFWGMGAGPDFHTIPEGHTNSHLGYTTLISSPVQTFNTDPSKRGIPIVYTDTKVYSKNAMATPPAACSITTPCSLRDYLYKQYNGNIAALNTAWGSNYTTFDSTGTQVSGEIIGKGDGSTKVFTAQLAHSQISPESILIKTGGVVQGGDCPWWQASCNVSATNTGSFGGASGTTIQTGVQPWLAALANQTASSYPAASFWAVITYHFPSGSGKISTPSRQVGTTYPNGGQQAVVIAPAPDAAGAASGYDVYMACRLATSTTTAFGCASANDPQPAPTLQASNVPFSINWTAPGSGLVNGTSIPAPPSSVNYTSGVIKISFSTPPAAGTPITADYITNGWMYGSGLMDEDGRNKAWLGSNAYCLSAALSCDGSDNPLPNANSIVAIDLDAWVAQFSAEYFKTCRDQLKKHDPGMLYFGADTVGTWGVPPRKEVLAGAAPYTDGLFTTWYPDQPNLATGLLMYQYITQYFGDKPLMNFMTMHATPDSLLSPYDESAQVVASATQAQRGQLWSSYVNSMVNTPSYNSSYQWVGISWWGLFDFWNEKTDWGLISLSDNPYDGKSAAVSNGKDAWGYATGGEPKNYGDAIDLVKQGNVLWFPQ